MKGEEINPSLLKKYVEITLVVLLYWFVSISLVFMNKHLLSSQSVKLEAPLFVTFYQCCCSALLCLFLSVISKLKLIAMFNFPHMTHSLATAKSVFPLSLVFVGMITFNNLSLKYVGVAFYFVGRSLTTVFNVIFTFTFLGEKTSRKAIICCCVIVFGFFLGVDQENVSGSLSTFGVVCGVLASVFVSLNSIFTKRVLPAVDDNIWLLTFYNNINAILLFIPLMLVSGEFPVVIDYPRLGDIQFWYLMTMSGIFGFAISFVTGLQIKVTSPLTHTISGTAKACTQTILACIWYNEVKSMLWWISNFLVMFGSAAYTRVKQIEMASAYMKSRLPKV
ncbi:GDP-fucose transporter 1-like protein [Dinothrombium tinctorium]|uniref:GDP-fucose transporter 1-like protein n=1 Tax=Dinothrombium tinctorium TaxID=1965070 RepID=A0A443R8N6_9ACAR|nr:GDP-fucose transporter 1-like protein [Dinothrombium tinctorium]RWS11012.1 GDP-fucose transporter 1-like protein [Dinothrombium tinctorium]RWS11641.1 GDP-fucose transporter 1-like protein [Dinothrombium tinctorium]